MKNMFEQSLGQLASSAKVMPNSTQKMQQALTQKLQRPLTQKL
jgi:hypothetical protein